MFFATDTHPLREIAQSAGSFDDGELGLVQQIFSEAWRILCDRQICSDGGAGSSRQREILARVALDVFSSGERDIRQAARRCSEQFLALAGSADNAPLRVGRSRLSV